MGDHAEAVQVAFDPQTITFAELLDIFWNAHNPLRESSSQYRAQLFCADAEQLELAKHTAARVAAEHQGPVQTQMTLGDPFHSAEAYHQKWRLRRRPLLFHAFSQLYASEAELLASTAAAKLNAYVSGHWVEDGWDLDALGLPTPRPEDLPEVDRPAANPTTENLVTK